jgi:hypothetical protein
MAGFVDRDDVFAKCSEGCDIKNSLRNIVQVIDTFAHTTNEEVVRAVQKALNADSNKIREYLKAKDERCRELIASVFSRDIQLEFLRAENKALKFRSLRHYIYPEAHPPSTITNTEVEQPKVSAYMVVIIFALWFELSNVGAQ